MFGMKSFFLKKEEERKAFNLNPYNKTPIKTFKNS